MRRRQFLTSATAAGAVAATAGCMGYSVTKTSKVNSLEDSVDEKEATIESLEEDVSGLEADLESVQQNNTALAEEVDGLEADVDAAKDKQVVYLYGYGVTHYNTGIDYYNRAISRFGEENYRAARADLNAAGGYFASASTNFSGAADRAAAIDAATVEEHANNAEQKAEHIFDAVADYQTAMAHYVDGDDSQGDEKVDAGDADYAEAEEISVVDRETIEDELGTSIETN